MSKPLHIKVCGMKQASNLEEVCALNPDYVGFIFVERSPRYVGRNPDQELFRIPGKFIKRVGVFVDEKEEVILEHLQKGHIDLVQLHGSESAGFCKGLKEKGFSVIKALPSSALESETDLEKWKGTVDYLLLDSPSAGQGGSGIKFDWSMMERTSLPRPFFLSGGISPEDAVAIGDLDHEGLYAVDVNSGFELEPGLKDVVKLERFIKELRSK